MVAGTFAKASESFLLAAVSVVGPSDRQVCHRELLEDCGVIGRRESEVVESCSQAVDGGGWGR